MTADALTALLETRLNTQQSAARYRRRLSLSDAGVHPRLEARELLTFCSNDYLGLATDPRVVEALCDGARRFGATGD